MWQKATRNKDFIASCYGPNKINFENIAYKNASEVKIVFLKECMKYFINSKLPNIQQTNLKDRKSIVITHQ